MKISTRGRYALRFMIDLAMQNSDQFIALKDISARQEISVKYLEQIASLLSKHGLLVSTRGQQGGYKLARRKIPSGRYTQAHRRTPCSRRLPGQSRLALRTPCRVQDTALLEGPVQGHRGLCRQVHPCRSGNAGTTERQPVKTKSAEQTRQHPSSCQAPQ